MRWVFLTTILICILSVGSVVGLAVAVGKWDQPGTRKSFRLPSVGQPRTDTPATDEWGRTSFESTLTLGLNARWATIFVASSLLTSNPSKLGGLLSLVPDDSEADRRLRSLLLTRAYQLARRVAQQELSVAMEATLPLTQRFDFAELAGRLESPARGAVVAQYGPTRSQNSFTYLRHSGLTFQLEPSSEVLAVGTGFVAHADYVRGYEGLVILDHGAGYHTVYAHLGQLSVTQGSVVEGRSPIGRSLDDGVTIYFELRHWGLPLDPSSWFGEWR